MKTKVLNKINAVIAFLLSVLGFSSCDFTKKYGVPNEIRSMYGTPYAEIEATGKVFNEQNEPVSSARVTLKDSYSIDSYTDKDGIYTIRVTNELPKDSISIVVNDTNGVYESDSVRIKVDYDRSDAKEHNDFYEGKASIYQDFQLKKK